MSAQGTYARLTDWLGQRLQRKLIVISAAILMTTSVTFLIIVVRLYEAQMIKEHARASLQVNHLLQASLENAMLKRDIEGLREIVDKLGVQAGIGGVMILNPDFEVRFSSHHSRLGEILIDQDIRAALKNVIQRTLSMSGENGSELLRSINPVRNREICSGCHGSILENPVNGLLIIDYDATNIKTNSLMGALMLAALGSMTILATGVGIWVALRRLVLERLHLLRKASLLFSSGDLSARAKLEGQDEIADLGDSFDHMAKGMSQSIEDLNRAENFLQNVIDSIPDGVRVINDNFDIVKANDAYCRQVGQSKDNVVGTKCYQSSHARTEPCPVTLVRCPVVELRTVSSPRMKIQQQQIDKDGSELFVEVSAARAHLPIGSQEVPCVIESIRDLAGQVKLSHEHRLSEIGFLAAGVAHEIHNPLSSIQFALKALQTDTVRRVANPKTMDYLDIADAEIQKCLKVTDGLLMLSQPPGELVELISLDQIIPDVLSLLSYQAEHEKVKIKMDLEENLRVVASDSDMRMIIVNLAQNAIHAMPGGGTLSVLGQHKKDQWIELKFVDTGIGITESDQEKIFLPFWTRRADASAGRGLGLSICKAIVERVDGRITLESRLDEGTCFTVLLRDADAHGKEQ